MWHTLSRSRRATIKRLSLLFIMLAGVGVAVDKFKKDATTHTEVLPWHQGGYEDHHGDIEEGMVPGGTFAGARMAAWETTGEDDEDALAAEEDDQTAPGGDQRDVRGGGGGGDGGGGDQYDGSYGEGVRADGIGNDDDAVERAAAGAGG